MFQDDDVNRGSHEGNAWREVAGWADAIRCSFARTVGLGESVGDFAMPAVPRKLPLPVTRAEREPLGDSARDSLPSLA
jgi:hypothetical protein